MQVGRVAQAKFRQHDLAFGIDGFGIEKDFAGNIACQCQGRIERGLVVGGKIEGVDCGICPGEGVGIGTRPQTDLLQTLEHLAIGNVRRSAENHVLDEVR